MEKALWYEQHTNEVENRKFTVNDIKSFVHKIFSMYERSSSEVCHVSADDFRDLISDEIYIEFPERTIHNWEEFQDWHITTHAQLESDLHIINNIEVEFLEEKKYRAYFTVRWYALYKDGNYVDQKLEQVWTIREEKDKELPVLEKNIVRIADFRLFE